MSQKLLLLFLKYVLLDSGILKKLLAYSTRDFWYIAVIFVLVISAVNLSVQQHLLEEELGRAKVTEPYCHITVKDPLKPYPQGPSPVPVEQKPPALPPDRRLHDVRRLLDEIE